MTIKTTRNILESMKTALAAISGINKVLITAKLDVDRAVVVNFPMITLVSGNTTTDSENDGMETTEIIVDAYTRRYNDVNGERATEQLDSLVTLIKSALKYKNGTDGYSVQLLHVSDTGHVFNKELNDEIWSRSLTFTCEHQEF